MASAVSGSHLNFSPGGVHRWSDPWARKIPKPPGVFGMSSLKPVLWSNPEQLQLPRANV